MSRNELGQNPLLAGMEEIQNSWGWFLAEGLPRCLNVFKEISNGKNARRSV